MPTIDILANTRQAQADVKDLATALDDVGDALDDVARDSNKSADKVEASFRDMQRASSRLEHETKGTSRDIANHYSKAFKSAEGDSDKAMRGMRDGAKEVTQEVGQNLGEAVSSIRGDLSDLGQVGQDTLGGLAATLAGSGPVGIVGAAALAAGAVGLGLVTAELEKQQEQAEALKARMTDAYTSASQAGRDYLDIAAIIADAQDVINNPERADEYQRLLDTQTETGLSMSTILKANAGDMQALSVVTKQVTDKFDEWYAKGEDTPFWQQEPLRDMRDYWTQTGDAATDAAQKATAALEAENDLLQQQIANTQDVQTEVDALGNMLLHLPDGDVMINADTKKATLDVSTFQGDVDGKIDTLNSREILLRVGVDSSAWDNWQPGDKIGNVRTAVGPGGAGGSTWY